MKLIFFLFLLLTLIACSPEEEATGELIEDGEVTAEEEPNEPTQEELNERLKEQAMEANFTEVNGGEVEEGTPLYIEGKVTFVADGGQLGEFTITTEENDGHGMYNIANFSMIEENIEEGQHLKVYGTYAGNQKRGSLK